MPEYYRAATVGDINDGEGLAAAINGRMVAIFREGDNYFAIDDLCPHMGASLAPGYLQDGIVTCPWHAWRFCIRDGRWCDNPKTGIDTFDVRVEGDEIQVAVPDSSPPGDPVP